MKSRDFCYWLMGSLELNENKTMNKKQTQQIKNHLNMVFKHEIEPDKETKPGFKIDKTVDEASIVFNC